MNENLIPTQGNYGNQPNIYGSISASYIDISHPKNYVKLFSEYYWKFLLIIGYFYILPALQFVFLQVQSKDDLCYYNNKCKHDLLFIPAFNNVISNLLYVVYGLIFIVIVKLNNKKDTDGICQTGVNSCQDLYYSLGLVLFFEGLCSAIFHICPSILNFQFDTTFMFTGTLLMAVTIYHKRNILPDPMKVYTFIAFLIFLNILPIYGLSNSFQIWFWSAIFLIMSYFMIFGSIFIYYEKEYDFDMYSFKMMVKNIKEMKKKDIPKFILLVCINGFSMGAYIYATITKPNFTDWLLGLSIINMSIYFCYYLIQKIKNKEHIRPIIWLWLVLDLIIFILSLIFFQITISDKFLTHEESDKFNRECVLFNYFDYHDIWHILSATGLFIFMNIVYFLDDNIDAIQVDIRSF